MGKQYTKTYSLHSASTGNGNGTVIDAAGFSAVGVQVTGTFVGTVHFEGTVDGSNWVAVQGANLNDGSVATSATAAGLFSIPLAGLSHFRARVAWTSGTSVTVDAEATIVPAGLTLADIDINASEEIAITANGITITQTPTVTAGAYSAGDNVGGLLTFANAARVSGGGGIIKDVLLIDDAGQDAETELWLFDTTFTAGSDNDAWAPTEAQLHTLITVVKSTDGSWIAGGTPSVCPIEVSRRYDCTGTSLFGRLVTRGTPTEAATDDITVRITLLQD